MGTDHCDVHAARRIEREQIVRILQQYATTARHLQRHRGGDFIL